MYICIYTYYILYKYFHCNVYLYAYIFQHMLKYEKTMQSQFNKLCLRICQKLIFKDEVLTQINFYLCKNKPFIEEQTWGYPKYPNNLKSSTIDFKGIFG